MTYAQVPSLFSGMRSFYCACIIPLKVSEKDAVSDVNSANIPYWYSVLFKLLIWGKVEDSLYRTSLVLNVL
jgi:hypothetical protein